MKHNLSAYVRGCRCDVCKTARRDYARAQRAKQPRNARKPWDEDSLIKLDALAGRPVAEIATNMGRSVSAIRSRLCRDGNCLGDTISLVDASAEYCPSLSPNGAKLRIEAMIQQGKLTRYRTSARKRAHWRIVIEDLERHREELAAPRKTWKCDEVKR